MIKIRTGLFETNSSSTHTCVLCAYSNYVRWCKGELAWVNRKYDNDHYIIRLLNKFTNPEESIVDNDFVLVDALDKIPLAKVYEESDYLLKYYNKKAEKYTVGDAWKIYTTFDYQLIRDWWGEENEFKPHYERAKEAFPYIDDIQEILNGIVGYEISKGLDIIYDSWNHFFMIVLGIYPVKNLLLPGAEQEEITRKNINGTDIISYCTYGHD